MRGRKPSLNQKAKIQITLPQDLAKEIEEDMKDKFLTKSGWFHKAADSYIRQNRGSKKRKLIDL